MNTGSGYCKAMRSVSMQTRYDAIYAFPVCLAMSHEAYFYQALKVHSTG